MNYLSGDKELVINSDTDEIFSQFDPNTVIAMKISNNYCHFNIMNANFREFKNLVHSGNPLHLSKVLVSYPGINSYPGITNEIPANHNLYIIKEINNYNNQHKYYLSYYIADNFYINIDIAYLTMSYESFDFDFKDYSVSYRIYKPTKEIIMAAKKLLHLYTPLESIDYGIRAKGFQGLDVNDYDMMKEYGVENGGGKKVVVKKTNTTKKRSKK